MQNGNIISYLVGVGVRHGLGGVDCLVEERVGEGGVVELVVAVAAVAHQVQEDVAPELALVLQAELRRLHHVLVRNHITLIMVNMGQAKRYDIKTLCEEISKVAKLLINYMHFD